MLFLLLVELFGVYEEFFLFVVWFWCVLVCYVLLYDCFECSMVLFVVG